MRDVYDVWLVVVGDADEDGTLRRQLLASGYLRLREGFAKIVSDTHDFSGGAHLGAKNRVDAGKFRPGKDRRLHVEVAARVEVRSPLDILRKKFAELASG